MVGSGDRSEKIRTYNFPQNRMTDHRIGLTIHQLAEIMDGKLQPCSGCAGDALRSRKTEAGSGGVGVGSGGPPPSTMQLRQALTDAVRRLEDEDVGSPRMNGEMLLMFTLDCDRAHLYAHSERELTADEQARYEDAIALRASGYPAQYITGHQEFWGLDLIVSPAVLIPRPETEYVVETTLDLVRAGACRHATPGPKMIDVGTGSGAIALALATELPAAEIHGVDLSREALEVAKANAARLQLEGRVHFQVSDVLEGVPRDGSFDSCSPIPLMSAFTRLTRCKLWSRSTSRRWRSLPASTAWISFAALFLRHTKRCTPAAIWSLRSGTRWLQWRRSCWPDGSMCAPFPIWRGFPA